MEKQEYFALVKSNVEELKKHRFKHRKDSVVECSCGWEYDTLGKRSKANKYAEHIGTRCAMAYKIGVEA